MRFLFLFAFLVLASALPPISEEDLNDNEIEVRHFDKCSKDQYFDIFTARCLDCTPCKPSEFVVFGCKPFDNYVCSTCDSTEYKGTFLYEKNCKKSPFDRPYSPFRLRDGMTNFGLPDKDTPFKIVSNDHLSTWDEDDSDEEILPKLPLRILDNNDDSNSIDRDDSDNDDEDMDEKPLPKLPSVFSNEDIDDDDDDMDEKPLPKLPSKFSDSNEDDDDDDDNYGFIRLSNFRVIRFGVGNYDNIFSQNFFGKGNLISSNEMEDNSADISDDSESEEIIQKVKIANKLPTDEEESSESGASDETSSDDDDGSSSERDSNSDSEETSQLLEQPSRFTISELKESRFSVSRCNQLILFLIIIGFKVLIIYLVVSCCCRNQTYRQKTITVFNVPEMSSEENNVLVRAVGFLEDKYGHNGKYKRLIGEDV